MTLEKYLPKETVVEKPTGIAEAPTAKQLKTYPDITNKCLLSDTSPPKKREITKTDFVCQWIERCEFYVGDGFCSYEKYCSQKGEVIL